jgi:hypothetical protein
VVVLPALRAAEAGEPDPANSYAEWRDTAGGTGKPVICPAGDGSYVFVSLRDADGAPVVGRLVTLDCSVPLCGECGPIYREGYTDANGEVTFAITNGWDRSGDTSCCSISTSVHSSGVDIRFSDSGVHDDSREAASYDYNGDCLVNEDDYNIFLSDYLGSACRSEFTGDGVVDLTDYSTWVVHNGHQDVSSVPQEAQPRSSAVRVGQISPNPFRRETQIEFAIEAQGRVTARIHDVMGRQVCTVLDENCEPGTYRITWDGRDASGRRMGSGIYFCSVGCGRATETRRIVLLD